jgi:hypothetical protein
MVRTQMLSELEEVITYKQFTDQPERQQMMRNTWLKRYVTSSFIRVVVIETFLDCKAVNRTSKFGSVSF